MKKLKSSLQTQVVDLWKFDDGTSLAHNGYVTVDLASNVIEITGSDLSFNALLTKQKDGVDSWVASYKNMYNFSGRLEADGDAIVKPCILYTSDNDNSLYIANSTEVTLSAENNYTSDFSVNTWMAEGQIMYLGFIVQKSDKSTVIKSHDNAFYSSRDILVAEKWSAEKNLPGLGITEDMADNAYTIVCPDTVTTLGLYLAGDTLCMVGMNTTATSFVAPSSVFINDKEYAVELFGKPKFDTFDWSGSQSVTALDLSGVKDVNLLFGGSSVTDLYLSTYCSINSYGYLGNIYLHLRLDGAVDFFKLTVYKISYLFDVFNCRGYRHFFHFPVPPLYLRYSIVMSSNWGASPEKASISAFTARQTSSPVSPCRVFRRLRSRSSP